MTLSPIPFTTLVGCRLPIQQAGRGRVTTTSLAAAAARGGGLGKIAAAGLGAEQVMADTTEAIATAGDGARVGVNFLLPLLVECF